MHMFKTVYGFSYLPDEYSEEAAEDLVEKSFLLKKDVDDAMELMRRVGVISLYLSDSTALGKKANRLYHKLSEWLYWHKDELQAATELKVDEDHAYEYENMLPQLEALDSVNDILNSVNKLLKKTVNDIGKYDDDEIILDWLNRLEINVNESTLTPKEAEAYKNGEYSFYKNYLDPGEIVEDACNAVKSHNNWL